MKLMQYITNWGVSGEPASKGAPLESVIPTKPASPKKNLQPAAPPPPKLVPPPLWLSGQLLASQRGRRASSQQRGLKGGGRGGQGLRGGHIV
jgi:hypothetical protein